MENLSVVIVAGGKGSRMGSEIPKQYIELSGKPILIHTIIALQTHWANSEYILVVPAQDLGFVQELIDNHSLKGISLTAGGSSRAESVWNGLKLAQRDFVAIHDGVRPFVSPELLERLMVSMPESNSVIPAVSPVDSVRIGSDGKHSSMVSRDEVFLIQTPQCFRREVLVTAYEEYFQRPNHRFTDDSSIAEHYVSAQPLLVEGERNNIKITTPKDLAIAEIIMKGV